MTTPPSNPSARPVCHLRATRIRLANGLEYTFRALPFNRATVAILEKIESPGVSSAESLLAICDAIERSLGYDQDPDVVAWIMDSGLIPLDMDGSVLKAIMGALFGKAFSGTDAGDKEA